MFVKLITAISAQLLQHVGQPMINWSFCFYSSLSWYYL